jgi:hypothetical protein
MHLIDEENTWYQLCDALVDIAIDYLVNLFPQFLGNLAFPWLHDLSHETHEIVATLRSGISHIQVMQCDILYNFFLFMDIPFGQWYIFFGFEIPL